MYLVKKIVKLVLLILGTFYGFLLVNNIVKNVQLNKEVSQKREEMNSSKSFNDHTNDALNLFK